jgi:hypothetical protein
MKKNWLSLIFLIGLVGFYSTNVFGANLTLPTGGRVAVELITSYASYRNTLSLVSPSASISEVGATVLTGCEIEGINAQPLQLLSEKISQHGCRVELDADPVAGGIQPFASGDTLEFMLCAQADANPATCEFNWSSNPGSNSDGKDHLKTTELYSGDPDVGGRIFLLEWEDQNNLGDEDFNDIIVVVRVMQDSDGDGLWDDWEIHGIDTDGNGVADYTIPDNPNPKHKDIYIEIDYFDCNVAGGDCDSNDNHSHKPKKDAIDEVILAFANADVPNPDGNKGITLHVDVDDKIAHANELNLGCFSGARNFDTIKDDSSFFGPDNPRRFTHHYVIFGHQQRSTSTSSGCGEIDGNDFIVTLGAWNTRCIRSGANGVLDTAAAGDDIIIGTSIYAGLNLECNTVAAGDDVQEVDDGDPPDSDPDGDGYDTRNVGTIRQQAGTLMHELGHNLNLEHGGDVCTNYKPNYLSIMSYRYQFIGIPPTGRLDYSAEDLDDLDEDNNLDEPVGINNGLDDTRYNCPDGTWRTGDGNAAIDWNCDDDGGTDTGVRVNINADCDDSIDATNCGDCDAGENDEFGVLTGYDDWEHLKYGFQNVAGFQDGVRYILDVPDMEFETYMIVINAPPVCDADGPYEQECQGTATTLPLDGSGSTDPDGDPLTFLWTTDCPGGLFDDDTSSTPEMTLNSPATNLPSCGVGLVVEDSKGGSDSCSSDVTIVDTTPPDIQCGAPATITPPDVPISFTATASDICTGDPSVEIIDYDCFTFTKKGKRIDKTQSCIVEISGDTITISDSGGVDDNIAWTVRATDDSGNVSESTCSIVIVNPGQN